jgi:hypothetical protein
LLFYQRTEISEMRDEDIAFPAERATAKRIISKEIRILASKTDKCPINRHQDKQPLWPEWAKGLSLPWYLFKKPGSKLPGFLKCSQ